MANVEPEPDRLLTPLEVATLFRVSPKTVVRWARTGRVPCIKTFGGHRRFSYNSIAPLLNMTTTIELPAAEPAGETSLPG